MPVIPVPVGSGKFLLGASCKGTLSEQIGIDSSVDSSSTKIILRKDSSACTSKQALSGRCSVTWGSGRSHTDAPVRKLVGRRNANRAPLVPTEGGRTLVTWVPLPSNSGYQSPCIHLKDTTGPWPPRWVDRGRESLAHLDKLATGATSCVDVVDRDPVLVTTLTPAAAWHTTTCLCKNDPTRRPPPCSS